MHAQRRFRGTLTHVVQQSGRQVTGSTVIAEVQRGGRETLEVPLQEFVDLSGGDGKEETERVQQQQIQVFGAGGYMHVGGQRKLWCKPRVHEGGGVAMPQPRVQFSPDSPPSGRLDRRTPFISPSRPFYLAEMEMAFLVVVHLPGMQLTLATPWAHSAAPTPWHALACPPLLLTLSS